MKVTRFVFNPFGENTYIIYDPVSREAAVVDPGMTDDRERQALDGYVAREGLKITHLINTHMHLDHIFGNGYVREKYGVKVEANPADAPLGENAPEQARRFGMLYPVEPSQVEVGLHDGDSFRLGDEEVKVIGVPGHSPGGIALYCPESGFVLTGDSLFDSSIGRTDLPGGDHDTLVRAVRERLLTLPPETVVLPGHGGETTVGAELRSNPYVR